MQPLRGLLSIAQIVAGLYAVERRRPNSGRCHRQIHEAYCRAKDFMLQRETRSWIASASQFISVLRILPTAYRKRAQDVDLAHARPSLKAV